MMPFSYHGLGLPAILLMLAVISAGQLVRYLRDHASGSRHASGEK